MVFELELYKLDVLLLDIDMPEMNGIEALKLVRKHNNQVKILMLKFSMMIRMYSRL
ncbi:MAG TPA: response regulator [Flavisolibacter sp.]|nr:response regulator [Flavisolibacter sp.]